MCAFRLITADERLSEANNKNTIAIFGLAGVGKTSLLLTLPEETTLCLDFEAGMKSVQSWRGSSVTIRQWQDAVDISCLLGGPDPARQPHETFSESHYNHVLSTYGRHIDQARYKYIFVDSITELTRIAMAWAQQQPEAFNIKGKLDIRGAYGLLGREVVRLMKHIQHAPEKTSIFIGGLDRTIDDFNRETWEPQTEGKKIGNELPFIVDQIATLSMFDYSDVAGWQHAPGKGEYRALVCKLPNPWGLPAKDRSGQLEIIEESHLGRLIEKINRPAQSTQLSYGIPPIAQ